MYYVFIQDNEINGVGQCRQLTQGVLNIEVSKEVYDDIERYIWNGEEVVLDPDYEARELEKAKEEKRQEADFKAKEFLEGGNALYELNEEFHIEASKENMNTFATAAIAIEKGLIPHQEWTSKEDNVLRLTGEQCLEISCGIGAIQSNVWNTQYIGYSDKIKKAKTLKALEKIVIDYF